MTPIGPIAPIEPEQATARVRDLLDEVRARTGYVSNFARVLANAPAALEGYLTFNDRLAGGVLSPRVRQQIALSVAEGNQCGYCLSSHTFEARQLGLTEQEIADARRGRAAVVKTDAILKLALKILVQRGEISDASLAEARDAGLTDGEVLETVANVAFNIFTNYLNQVARTMVDFPEVKPGGDQFGI